MIDATENRRPSLAVALAVCTAAAAVYTLVRLYLYSDSTVPLTYALPLLLGLWHKNRRLHYGLVVFFSVLAATQVFLVLPTGEEEIPRPVSYLMMLINIGTVGLVVDQLILSQEQLWLKRLRLEQANAELEASNEELASREEEISSQNEELQRQTEELEQQMEELQQQSEELQQQGEELQLLNEESTNRERVLQALLEVSTGLGKEGGLTAAADRICESSLIAYGPDVSGALVVVPHEEQLLVCGHCGVLPPTGTHPWIYRDPYLNVVIQERRTVAIENLAQTPEVPAPIPDGSDGDTFRAALAAPICSNGRVNGVLALYSSKHREWTESDFKTIQWLAAQAALVLHSVRLQEELDQRTRQAEEASRRKTRFLAAVSHDVRTPANAISLMAEVIKQTGLREELVHEIPHMAEALRANAKLLVELVSDVLDLSRFDSGKVDLEHSEFSLQEVVQAEIAQHQSLAKASGLTLAARAPDEQIWLYSDRMKLARVLGNLLGNALKFTDTGSVEVVCERTGDGAVLVHVVDTGVGIHHDQLEHIFDEFYQINNPERDRSKGTGLGLAICKRLIDAIGCTISVRSEVGQGTTFTIRIPKELIIDCRTSAPAAVVESREHQLSGLRVLIVEDHEVTRTAVAALLANEGATVDQAADGRAALRMFGHHPPDVLLVDLMLPDMDGREILQHVLARRPPNLRCVLAVSGDVTLERQKEIDALGADGLVPKPVQIEVLTQRICEQVEKTASTSVGTSPPTA